MWMVCSSSGMQWSAENGLGGVCAGKLHRLFMWGMSICARAWILASDSRCQECASLIMYFALTCLYPQITDNTLIQLAVNCPNIQKLVRQLLTIIPTWFSQYFTCQVVLLLTYYRGGKPLCSDPHFTVHSEVRIHSNSTHKWMAIVLWVWS